MIREISQSPTGVHSKVALQTKNVKNSGEVTNPVVPTHISKYSSNNIKANYLGQKALSNISFRGLLDEPLSQNITSLPDYKLSNAHYYDELANDVAILLGPNKNALLTNDEGASAELLTHNFTRNLLDKKYTNEGLHPYNTDVVLFDAGNSRGGYDELMKIAAKDPAKKKVVFVENFHMFLLGLQNRGINAATALKEGGLPGGSNVQLVGIMPKGMHQAIMEGKVNIDASSIRGLGKVDFNGLNAADTKDLLKKDARYITNIFKRYKEVDLKISYNAIDELVDKSAATIDGSFPGKALKVIDLTAAAKATELKSHKPGAKVVINSADVKRFFENHTEIVDGLKPLQGQFTLAENVKTKLADVGGISTLKEEINDDILSYLKDPKKFAKTGRTIPNGKLLTGPPGNGKTLLARAIAGETGVPFIAASGSEFVEKYVGVGAQRMRELFETARKAAASSEKKIAIIFIDEIDAFAKARGTGGSGGESESEKTLNQLLTEMDGFNKNSKTKVFVMAATNRKDIIDPALLRFGRFDGGIEVTAPATIEDRLEILRIHARNKQFASEAEKTKILTGAAKITEGMSGADLAGVMGKAAKVVSKRTENQIITYNDMIEGFLQVHAGPIKKSDLSLEDKKMVVRHEAGHAVVLDSLKQDKISFITLDGRGDFLGAVFHGERKGMPNFKSVIYSAATSYAGGHAEPGFETKGHGAGVSGDLENATNLIERAIKKWGLGVHTPQISIGDAPSKQSDNLLNMYQKEIKEDINLFTKTAQTVSKKIVDFHQGFLDEYMDKFEKNVGKGGNNLSGEEFTKMREDWIVRTGKTKQFQALQKEIEKMVEVAQTNKVSFAKRILKVIIRR